MIVLIVGEGQFLADEAFAGELNELRAKVEAAIELGDEVGFRSALAELRSRARSTGRPVASGPPTASDLVVPPEGAAMDVTRRLLADQALSAQSWAWSEDQERPVARPLPPERFDWSDRRPPQASPSPAGLAPAGLAEAAPPAGGAASPPAPPDLEVRTRRSVHQLTAGTTYQIGRDPKSNIVMTDSRVSWRHGEMRAEADGWVIEDLGSTNGTFLGAQRLDRIEIREECVVRLGNPDDGPVLRCVPQIAASPAAPAAPEAEPEPAPRRDSESWWQPAQEPAPRDYAPRHGSGAPPQDFQPPADYPPPQPAVAPRPAAPAPPAAPTQQAAAQPVPSDLLPTGKGAFSSAAGPVTYDTLVRTAFAENIHPGRLLFNPPDRMRLGQTERVEVRLTRALTLDGDLLEQLRGHGEPQLEKIPTAPLMAVTLKGDGFRIAAYSDEEQIVTQEGITTWEFDICALKRGQQRLVICVSLRIPVECRRSEHKSIPVREATIDVQVGAAALVWHFVAANWQWFIGTAIAIAAILVAVLH